MDKKNVLELKRRLTKDAVTFTRVTGVYVSAEKREVTKLASTFLTLEEEDFHKLLEIAKKVFSGKTGENIMTLDLQDEEAATSLLAVRNSQLKDENILDTFYQRIIDTYESTTGFMILLFHDVYDVCKRNSDGKMADDSEEVYEYIIGAVCPVDRLKPSLGYKEDSNAIGSVYREWLAKGPETGFVYPAFNDRSADIHSVMFYTKNAKKPHSELAEDVLGAVMQRTAAEKREQFYNIARSVYRCNGECEASNNEADDLYYEIQQNILLEMENRDEDDHHVCLDALLDFPDEADITDSHKEIFKKLYHDRFDREEPKLDDLYDPKFLAAEESQITLRRTVMENMELRALLKRAEEFIPDEPDGAAELKQQIREQ